MSGTRGSNNPQMAVSQWLSRQAMRLKSVSAFVLFLSSLSLASCGDYDEYYCFDRSESKADTVYSFSFELLPAPVEYEMSFFARFVGGNMDFYTDERIPMDITVISPSGRKYVEKTCFSASLQENGNEFYVGRRDAVSPYRSGVKTDEPGIWAMQVRMSVPHAFMTGLGLWIEKSGGSTNKKDRKI